MRFCLLFAFPIRPEALVMLRDGEEACLRDFIEHFGVPQPNMSRHRGVLRRAAQSGKPAERVAV